MGGLGPQIYGETMGKPIIPIKFSGPVRQVPPAVPPPRAGSAGSPPHRPRLQYPGLGLDREYNENVNVDAPGGTERYGGRNCVPWVSGRTAAATRSSASVTNQRCQRSMVTVMTVVCTVLRGKLR